MSLRDAVRRWRQMDVLLSIATALLLVFGLAAVFSAGRATGASLFQRQMAWTLLGIAVYLVVPLVDYQRILQWTGWAYVFVVVLLVATLLWGTGVYETRRWLRVGPIQVQPAELAKVVLILVLARYLGSWTRNWRGLGTTLGAGLLAAPPFLLVALQPDLGTAVTMIPVTIGMLWMAGLRPRHLLLLCLLAAGALAPLAIQMVHYIRVLLPAREAGIAAEAPSWYLLIPYQCDRILVFIDSGRDPLGDGWSLLQSRIAIGSGGWFGKGWLHGTQNVLGFLPRTVAPTDFIFSVIAEENGFIGALILIALYGVVLVTGARIAAGARDLAGRLIAVGITLLLFCHIFVNIGMTVGLMPVTGLPLPLISYGGSFLVSTLASIGLLQGVYIRRHQL